MKKHRTNTALSGRLRRFSVLLAAVLLLGGLPLSAGAAGVKNPVYPSWFSFPESCLSLANENVHIGPGYYQDAYGPLKGLLLWDLFESGGSHGLCYGLAVANAALLHGAPSVDGFFHADGSPAASVSDLQKGTVDGATALPLMSLLRYGYLLQAGTETALNYERTKNDAKGLYAAVSDFVYRGGPPVIVGLLGAYSSHQVLAVGLQGREDIVICDSNDPSRPYLMDFTGDRWSYSAAGMSWRSPRDTFDYAVNAELLYSGLLAAGETVFPEDYVYDAPQEAEGTAEVRRAGIAPLDGDWALLAYNDSLTCGAETTARVAFGAAPLWEEDDGLDYYWTPQTGTAALWNKEDAQQDFLLAGEGGGIMGRVPAGGSASAALAEDGPMALITGTEGDAAAVALLSLTGDALDGCVADGLLEGGELYAAAVPAGFLVDGLREFTVTFLRRGGEASEAVACAAGPVLIRGGYADFTVSRMGDVNGDGDLTPEDARLALRGAVALEDVSRFDFALCDYNGDGGLTPEDARLILRRTVGLRD